MWLVVGLGNPGLVLPNRHNIGFMAVDEVARAYSFAPWRKSTTASVQREQFPDLVSFLRSLRRL